MNAARKLIRSIALLALFGQVVSSHADPLDNWTIVPSGTTNQLYAVTFGAGKFVAAGISGTILTSTNGLAWTTVATGITNTFFGAAYGQGQFAVVGSSGVILTSSDAVTWNPQYSGTTNHLNAVASTQFGLVAVGDLGTITISSNGSNWIVQSPLTPASLVGVCDAFGKTWVNTTTTMIISSTNTSVWTTNSGPYFIAGLAYGNGVLMGITIRSGLERTTNGVNWSRFFGSFNNYCYGVTFARNRFAGVGGQYGGGVGRTISTTSDGITWKTRYFKSAEGRLVGIFYGAHRFVAVGDNGSILASDPLLSVSSPSIVSNGVRMIIGGALGGVYRVQRSASITSPVWEDQVTVTNTSEATEVTAPLLPDAPAAFYRITAD